MGISIIEGTLEYQVGYYLWAVVSPVLIIFGTVGNVVCIVVMSRRRMRSTQTSVYLLALSVADILVLNTGLMRHFINEIGGFDVRELSETGCKINLLVVYLSLDVSVWILVAFTFERILSVFLPHKVKHYCSRVTSLITITAIVVVFFVLNSHLLYGMVDLSTSTDNASSVGLVVMSRCVALNEDYNLFLETAWPWIDFTAFSLIPILILSIGNSCIVVQVMLSRRRAGRAGGGGTNATSTVVNIVGVMPHPEAVNPDGGINKSALPKLSRTSSMTATLLALNLVFLVTTVPVSVYFIIGPTWMRHVQTPEDLARLYLTFTVLNLIQYVNNSSNFVMYSIAGSKFRRELRIVFARKRVYPLDAEARHQPSSRRPQMFGVTTETQLTSNGGARNVALNAPAIRINGVPSNAVG